MCALPGDGSTAGETDRATHCANVHEDWGVLASTDDILARSDDYLRGRAISFPRVVCRRCTVTPNVPPRVAASYRISPVVELFPRKATPRSWPSRSRTGDHSPCLCRVPTSRNRRGRALSFFPREVPPWPGRDTRVDHFEQPSSPALKLRRKMFFQTQQPQS